MTPRSLTYHYQCHGAKIRVPLSFFSMANISAKTKTYAKMHRIRAPDALESWNKWGQKSCDTVNLTLINIKYMYLWIGTWLCILIWIWIKINCGVRISYITITVKPAKTAQILYSTVGIYKNGLIYKNTNSKFTGTVFYIVYTCIIHYTHEFMFYNNKKLFIFEKTSW